MKILVTGADGFIGSHLTEALVRDGHDVRAFVMYNSFNSWGWLDRCEDDVSGQFEVFAGDVRDPRGVEAALKGCDAVFHLAALIGIPYSYHSPHTYVDTNINGTLNVLQAARNLNLSRVIHTSTSEVYGSAKFVPITEDHPIQAQSPYSATKVAADQIAMSFHRSFDLPVAILRPFNTYGPRQSARAVIPTIISQVMNNNGRVQLGMTSPTRDFNFVSDTVDGFKAALLAPSAVGEVINLGSNFEVSILDTAKIIGHLTGVEVNISNDPSRVRPQKSEVDRLWASNEKAKSLLGWNPKYAGMDGFKLGLGNTIDWFSRKVNLSAYKTDIYNV